MLLVKTNVSTTGITTARTIRSSSGQARKNVAEGQRDKFVDMRTRQVTRPESKNCIELTLRSASSRRLYPPLTRYSPSNEPLPSFAPLILTEQSLKGVN